MDRAALSRLSKDDLIALVLAQADVISRQSAQIEALAKRVEELEAKLGKRKRWPRPIGFAVDERVGSDGWSANHQLVCNKICSFCRTRSPTVGDR